MKNFNRYKAFLIKNVADRFNDEFYPYLPPQLPSEKEIDGCHTLEELEEDIYQDTLNRIDPDGIYHYRWHPQQMLQGECIPDLGDMLLHQGILLGAVSLRLKQKGEGGVSFKAFDTLLKGMELFIEDGYLIRGVCQYKKVKTRASFIYPTFIIDDLKWVKTNKIYADKVSGDQLAGFCFGLSLAYHLHPEKFNDSLKNKILSLADRMIANKMMLQERDGSIVSGSHKNWFNKWWTRELPYDSWRIIEGHTTTKLALLSLANEIDKSFKSIGDLLPYQRKYNELVVDYSFDSLAEYSSILFGSLNNFFGTNICALSLFTIGLNMDFPDYVKRGLSRIDWQTRDYGFAIFGILSRLAGNPLGYRKIDFEKETKKKLYSYFISCGEDKFKRSIFLFGQKKRVSALSIRARGREDLIFSRNPFVDRSNFNPDLWAIGNTGMDDFMIEYWLAKHLEIV